MEVILLEDVKNVGKKGEVVKVNDGYGRNVLIKKKQALEATGKNLNDLKLKKANDDKIAAENLEAAKELSKKIEAASITVAIKLGEGGKTFGSVSSKEIAEEVKAQLGYDVDKKKVQLKDAIKTVGDHEVKIKLHPQVTTTLKVKVEGK
jgi:large subunit ribosomal protein L9